MTRTRSISLWFALFSLGMMCACGPKGPGASSPPIPEITVVEVYPRTERTNVEEVNLPLDYYYGPSGEEYRGEPPEAEWFLDNLQVENEAGQAVAVTLSIHPDPRWMDQIVISQFPAPGWYRVSVTHPLISGNYWASGWRPVTEGGTALEANYLVGDSSPGIAWIERCGPELAWVTVAYSEHVTLPTPKEDTLSFFDAQGNKLPCEMWSLQPQSAETVLFNCANEPIAALVVNTAPVGSAGGVVAVYPQEGERLPLSRWWPPDVAFSDGTEIGCLRWYADRLGVYPTGPVDIPAEVAPDANPNTPEETGCSTSPGPTPPFALALLAALALWRKRLNS